MLTSSKKNETAVHGCNPTISVLVVLVSDKVYFLCSTISLAVLFVMFLKVYFLNFSYFFIAKKQQLVLYFYISYREIKKNQSGGGAFARFLQFANFFKRNAQRLARGGWALLELTDVLIFIDFQYNLVAKVRILF